MHYNITTNGAWYSVKKPEAFITKAKKRIKQNLGKVYLSDGDEYEIELFNPTQDIILAKIKLDGNYISGGGIVLRRGERVFLERFLDSPKKFKFSTYEVNGKNVEAQESISKNGNVEVEFYSEYKPFTPNVFLYGNGTTTTTPINGCLTTFTTTGKSFSTSAISTNTFYNASLNSKSLVADTFDKLEQQKISHLSDRKIETGITEMGDSSAQTFEHSNKSFNSIAFYNVYWKIFPNTEKQYTAEELSVSYCGNCGSKKKKSSFKFCPHCGTKF